MSKLYQPSPRVPGAEHLAVFLAGVVDRVVFAGHGEDVRGVQPGQHLLDLVELVGCGQMGQVAGVDHEVRGVPEAVDLVDRLGEGAGNVRVGGALEADVAVADLGEAQGRSGLGVRRAGGAGDMGDHFAAGDGQPDRRAEPRGMADQLPAGHAPRIAVGGHLVTTTVPCMNGWIEQM